MENVAQQETDTLKIIIYKRFLVKCIKCRRNPTVRQTKILTDFSLGLLD